MVSTIYNTYKWDHLATSNTAGESDIIEYGIESNDILNSKATRERNGASTKSVSGSSGTDAFL